MENQHSETTQKPFLKALFVGLLSLALLIPLLFVQYLVEERSHRKDQVVREISNQWSNEQMISALKIKIPVTSKVRKWDDETRKTIFKKEIVYWSPLSQKIEGDVLPQVRKKSIYQAILYTTNLKVNGAFDSFKEDDANYSYHFDQAELILEVSDFRGLQNEVEVIFNGKKYKMENSSQEYMSQKLENWDPFKEKQVYSFDLNLKGSSRLSFFPSAAQTEVTLNSSWKDPGFFGAFLPTHDISQEGFAAKWNVLELNRSIPRVSFSLNSSFPVPELRNRSVNSNLGGNEYEFGVNLVEVANNYQKNERASKYGILIIVLTFMAFFFIEMFFNKRINLIQYLLIGLGLVIFYTLLLSFSEFVVFNLAYAGSAVMTIGLIVLFAKSLFGKFRPAILVGGILSILYGFIFTIIQLEDTALLVGSLGLFLILAITMYVSRVIKWD